MVIERLFKILRKMTSGWHEGVSQSQRILTLALRKSVVYFDNINYILMCVCVYFI